MIQILGVALLAVGGLYAWSALQREMKRLDDQEREAREKRADPLEYDPATGRYRAKVKSGRSESERS